MSETEPQQFLPLCVAAAFAYGRLLKRAPRRFQSAEFDEQLDLIALALSSLIPVYASTNADRPPLRLSYAELASGAFRGGARRFVRPGTAARKELKVCQTDLFAAIQGLALVMPGSRAVHDAATLPS